MIINTNISSLNTRYQLSKTNDQLQNVMEKLSSGKRINSAGDDAAGLAVATRMTSAVRGMEAAMRNANDGISMIQTAESAMGSVVNILQRVRELAVQADNGTNSGVDRDSLNSEVQQLLSEVTHIASATKFNGVNLLDGGAAGHPTLVNLHISDLATDTMTVTLYDMTLASSGLNLGTISIDSVSDAQTAIQSIDAALNKISSSRATLGATQNRLEFTIDNLNVAQQNTIAARSRIEDTDMAKESSELTKNKILSQSSIAMLAQANQNPQSVLQLLQ